jgi:hypothetical protein
VLFPTLFAQLEKSRWNMQKDIPWHTFDRSRLTADQLHGIRMNAILEWSAMPTAEMFLRDNYDDIDFSAFVSIWFFEEQKHSLLLLEYLRRISPECVPAEQDLARVRFVFDPAPALETLALHFCAEIRLHHWYRCASAHHSEPLIREIYKTLANDEARHARSYFAYMQRAVERSGDLARLAFSKIGVLMTNARLNRAMHPTNLHVNQEFYPNDTVTSRLPDPEWLERWLDQDIDFDKSWEQKVQRGVLGNLSTLLQQKFTNSAGLRAYRKQLAATLGVE